MMKLSILDQSTISEGSSPVEALAQTGRMAQEAERMGYHRFWVSEHHFSPNLAGSSPEVLISHLAAITSTLRVGSGGVMLPHYSSYKVAENFRVLEGLYPGRIDLGLGRAPGGMPLATQALQEGRMRNVDRYAEQIADLSAYLTDTLSPAHPFAGLLATPLVRTVPQMWMLGSSGGSSGIAAQQGTGFAFAQFINGSGGADAMRWYQENFRPSAVLDKPQSLLAIFAVCAETEEQANRLASSMDLSLLLLEKGVTAGGTPSVQRALSYPYSPYDRMRIQENRKRMIVGSPDQIKWKIERLCEEYRTDEVMITSIIHRFEDKLQSFRLIAKAFGLSNKV
ncbi:LLM class flavin-dependent oxidoreductase [Paenibacillus sp. KQZ6P-2]|uniref:LLM class flavin-dependent oxidoreductase n=1 Tax=Paenibacillus mangrovi TaxID=2931978 RepID=A0A9X2B3C5_9BACL|nr:LLM class flavin-dependent oxidoreductase [Paenibacillus mangrovi]MCJ8012840.1 LLM class flavin-dependent oxidoreductase [Paenibacillus mangrovi]